MVDPVTLGVIVTALVAKLLDRAEDKVLDDGQGVLRRLVRTLRERFSRTDDQPAMVALERVEDAPDSPTRMRELALLLDERAAGDPGFRGELEAFVREAERAGVDVDSITQTVWGDQNVVSNETTNSSITVAFEAAPRRGRTPNPES